MTSCKGEKEGWHMIATNEGYARLEYFSRTAAADSRRKEFDIKNHSLIYTDQKPDFLFIGDSITHYWELNAADREQGNRRRHYRISEKAVLCRCIAVKTQVLHNGHWH